MMLDTYRLLIGLMNRELVFDDLPIVSQAMEGIQLLGTPQQIQIAKAFSRSLADTFAAGGGTFNLDDLLISLRESIREDLELEKVHDDLFHLKVIPNTVSTEVEAVPSSDAIRAGG